MEAVLGRQSSKRQIPVTFPRAPAYDETTEMGARPGLPADANEPAALHLLVMGDGVFRQFPLTCGTRMTIGRGDAVDVRLSDPRASRRHACLHVGEKLFLEDLGSANGTAVRDVKLESKERREVAPGEPISIGSTVLMVQRTWAREKRKVLWPHGYFETRLEEECSRAERAGATFAVLRVRLERGQGERGARVVAKELRNSDVLANYGPDDFEILLVDTKPDLIAATVKRILDKLSKEGLHGQVGAASFPRDARAPAALIAQACAAVSGVRADGVPIVLHDESMVRLHQFAERMAQGNISVLILGETGVGKEILAETIHRGSPRSAKPFVRLNCAAFVDTLAESELFGYERGAFTGAVQAKPGLLETADGGTIFLDEVGELSMVLQGKILRVLETHEVVRVGGLKQKKIDVRFVAATNRDLETNVLAGTFRRDLYFRLNGATLAIPPLRERPSEILYLAESFVEQVGRQLSRPLPAISKEARVVLEHYSWPGNIRELKNVIERAVLLCTGDEIEPEHLPIEKMKELVLDTVPRNDGPRLVDSDDDHDLDMATSPGSPDIMSNERARILDALAKCAGNQSRAAKLLGISRGTLISRLDSLGIARPRK
jgi:DNA-binding NtrC family response regulator